MSNSGETLPVCWRLRREGIDVAIYLHHPQYRRNYEGILPRVKASELKKELKRRDIVVFDITRPNEKTKYDAVLLKTFGLKMKSPGVFGPVAEKLKGSHKVIGGGVICEELELDRKKGVELARKIGFAIPKMHEFDSLSKGAKFLKDRSDLWVFKPDNNQDLDLTYVEKFPGELLSKIEGEYIRRIGDKCDYILQEKIDGTELSTEVWIGKQGPVHFNHTIESKRLMDANLGPAIGSQSNTVWINEKGLLVSLLTKMAEYLQSQAYIGPCDANCIIKDRKPYFLEWTPRFGYDAIFCLFSLLKSNLSEFFTKNFRAQFGKGYAASQRISIPPYPYADSKLRVNYAKQVSIANQLSRSPYFWAQDVYLNDGKLLCAGADGILGIVTGRGDSLGAAWGNVYHSIGKLKVASYLQYRTDGYKEAEKRFRSIKVG
jgi:phosphoribosylamine--glycine ligase